MRLARLHDRIRDRLAETGGHSDLIAVPPEKEMRKSLAFSPPRARLAGGEERKRFVRKILVHELIEDQPRLRSG